MGKENIVAGLTWREVMEILFNIYRGNSKFLTLVFAAVVIIGIVIAFSLR